MHALFFEVRPHPGHLVHYFEHVDRLRPALARHDGLAFLDRYGALDDADLLLSHQLWESEEAIIAWRSDVEHLRSQSAGRRVHFADYRIRVGERVLHWSRERCERLDDAGTGADTQHVLALYGDQPVTGPGFSAFESVNHPGRFIALATFPDFSSAEASRQARVEPPGCDVAAIYRIRRDYGQYDRAQAPG
jgi:heme-degrading monooxygenase HmoA